MRSVDRGLEIPSSAPQHEAEVSPIRRLNCPVCGHPSPFEDRLKDADLYRCPECDHCFSDPETLRGVEEYGPEYYEKDWFQNDNTKLFETIARLIAAEHHTGPVIDVGCGNGAFLKYLRRRLPNLSLAGIDFSRNESCDGIEFFEGDVLRAAIGKQFDVVVSLAVIEHVVDVRGFMNRLYDLCAPNGTVFIMTMNDRSLLYGTARLLARLGFSMAADQLYSRHHVNHFNLESLQRLICSSGLLPVGRILHNIPIAAVDIASGSPLVKGVLRAGVRGIFTISQMTGSTYLQTVMCQKRIGA